jgi:acylphosphatase
VSEAIRVRIIVRGRVQGVWFRGSARDEARRLGLSGWARNRADGAVEILAQGAPAAIERLVEWCHEGPPLARVKSVERTFERIPRGEEDELAIREGFEVR